MYYTAVCTEGITSRGRRAPFYRCVEIMLESLSLAEPHLQCYRSVTVPRQELKGHKGSFDRCLRLVVVVRIGFWKNSFLGVCTLVSIFSFQPSLWNRVIKHVIPRGIY
jgi:hypothetical protein